MKIKYNIGCITDNIELNGVDFNDTTIDQQREFVSTLTKYNADEDVFQRFISDFMESNNKIVKCECLGYCDECGDTAYEYTFDTDKLAKTKNK